MFSLFKKKEVEYEIPRPTSKAFNIFKEKVLEKEPDAARRLVKTLFIAKNNGIVHPKWVTKVSDDRDIRVHVRINLTAEETVASLLNICTLRSELYE